MPTLAVGERERHYCPHCRHRSIQRVVAVQQYRETYDFGDCLYYIFTLCEVCEQGILYDLKLSYEEHENRYWDDEYFEGDGFVNRTQCLWPCSMPALDEGVPIAIVQIYVRGYVAMKAQPEYYALQVRKALEAICTEMGIPEGEGLRARLHKLRRTGQIQDIHLEIAQEIVTVLNMAAHNDLSFRPSLMPFVHSLFKGLLTHLYSLPHYFGEFKREMRNRS